MQSYIGKESDEQSALFQWADYQKGAFPELKLMFHIPNGGSRNKIEARNLKLQGVKPGVPDLFLPAARMGYHGLFIEMKREHGGKLSSAQTKWLEELTNQGYKAVVAEGWIAAAKIISDYLKEGNNERIEDWFE